MRTSWGEGAARAVETLLRMAGSEVVLRLTATCVRDAPAEEVTLRPCVLRRTGDTAELLVSAEAVKRAFGVADSGAGLFPVSARVVADETVWRVAGSSAVECGGVAIAWRLQLVR